MKSALILMLAVAFAITVTVSAQVPYDPVPDWLSDENSDNGTGCAFDDVNKDGFLDLAVSNGNDIVAASNYIYINDNGVLPNSASWISADEKYSGHCELADIDADGYPEFMVANYISSGWEPATVQIYANEGGELETSPSWETADSIYSFRASFGDADGDGDLDLAVATGEAYYSIYEQNLIYYNVGGTLETTPGWISDDYDASYDVQFVDIENDGDLDVAFLCSGGRAKIYYNEAGSIETTPSWQTSADDNGNSFDFVDLNTDGYLDLGVAFNTQHSGTGKFAIFFSESGTLPSSPDWVSSSSGFGSEAVFSDVDNDGDYDFVTGRWFGMVYIYLNNAGVFNTGPDWMSHPSHQLVVENIVFGDVDNGAEITTSETFPGDGQRRQFYLSKRHLSGVEEVVADGEELPLRAYCYHLKNGWISLSVAPADSVAVRYRSSPEKDMAVSNWGGSTYIFTNRGVSEVAEQSHALPSALSLEPAYPNPFNATTMIRYSLPSRSQVRLAVFDILGRKVETLVWGNQQAGTHTVIWSASESSSGIYLYQLTAGDRVSTKRMTVLK